LVLAYDFQRQVPARNESKGLVEKDEPSCWEMQGDVRP